MNLKRVSELIARVRLLESKFGYHAVYKNFDPFIPLVASAKDIQISAKKIADFLGLKKWIFVVTFVSDGNIGEKTAGMIELSENGDNFIEISRKYCGCPEAVGAIMCHEISHRYLAVKGIIPVNSTLSNAYEELTDVVALWAGLGKMILNGIKTETVTETDNCRTTTTSKIGYLTEDEFAFVYLLVCKMRKIDENDMFQGLNRNGKEILSSICDRYGNVFLHSEELALDQNRKLFYDKLLNDKRKIAQLDKYSVVFNEQNKQKISQSVKNIHRKIFNIETQSPVAKFLDYEVNPCVIYIDFFENVLYYLQDLHECRKLLEKAIDEVQNMKTGNFDSDEKLVDSLIESQNFMQLKAVCPIDGNTFGIECLKKVVYVKCQKCKYSWYIDLEPPLSEKREVAIVKLLKNIRSFFKKKSRFD